MFIACIGLYKFFFKKSKIQLIKNNFDKVKNNN